MIIAHTTLVYKPKGRRTFERLQVNGRIILKQILKE
jgi:hypothetical protein